MGLHEVSNPTSCTKQTQLWAKTKSHKAFSSLLLKPHTYGRDSMTSLFHCLGIISRKTSPTGISHLNLCLLTLFLLSCTMLKSLALFSPCHPCRQGAARVPPNHLCYRNKPKFLCPSSQCKHFSYWSNWRPILVASVEDTPEEWGYNLFPHSLRQVQMLLALLLPGSLLVHAQLVAHQHCGPLPQTRPNQAVTACLITKNSPLPAVWFCSYPFWIM